MSKIFIAIPAYDGKVVCETMAAVCGNVMSLQAAGHHVAVCTESGNCYLDRLRNSLMDKFVQSGYDIMFFVDADLGFADDAMLKLLQVPKHFVFGAYPCKGTNTWTIQPIADQNGVFKIRSDGTIECTFGPTGLMKIHRPVLLEIMKQNKELGEQSEGADPFPFFRVGYDICEDKKWSGEDVYFCWLHRKSGGKCWCYLDIDVDHVGISHTKGNCLSFVEELKKAGK